MSHLLNGLSFEYKLWKKQEKKAMGLKRTKLKSKKNDGVDFEETALVPEILTQDLKQEGALLASAERTTHLRSAEPSKSYPYKRS